MCYHASVSLSYQQLEDQYQRPFDADDFPPFKSKTDVIGYHLNGFNHPILPVITQENPDCFHFANWGLIPSWTKDFTQAKQLRIQTLNAKSETVFEKPAFRGPVKRSRCLFPSTGFFEWQERDSKTKVPFFIHLKGKAVFSIAAIYDTWFHPPEDKTYCTFSILTTHANPMMANIHRGKERMPVILNPDSEKIWLDPNAEKENLIALFQPFLQENMEAYTISPLVSSRKVNSNVKEVLLPFDYSETSLFT